MASFESSENKAYSVARKQDDQSWVASSTPADFFIDNKGSLTTIKDMLIQQISLQQLRRICVKFKITGYRNKTKMITITLITKNWLKTLDLRDMMGYNKKSSKEPKKNLKRNGAPFTPESSTRLSPRLKRYLKRKGSPFPPESSTRKSPRLLLSKQLSTTREDIANDSSTDSELSPSQLSAFPSPVPADILLDDDSERSHQIFKKK
jgi:hypothetical protein